MSLAGNLKRLRTAAPLTQEELAATTGIKQTAISRYEKGKSLPDLSSLLKLATGLRVPLEALVEGVDVRFDLVYKGLRATVTEEPDADESGMEAAEPSTGSLPGAPIPMVPDDEPDAEEVAATHQALHRALAQLVSVVSRLPAGPVAVARHVGSDVRPRAAQARKRARPRNAPRATAKRR